MAAKKRTSRRVSSLAARTLRKLDGVPGSWPLRVYNEAKLRWVNVKVGDVKSLAASCVSQDEVRGAAKGRKR